jgi:hypothetical protein
MSNNGLTKLIKIHFPTHRCHDFGRLGDSLRPRDDG